MTVSSQEFNGVTINFSCTDDCWKLIYNGSEYVYHTKGPYQVSTQFTIEEFATEAELTTRASALGLTIPEEEE